MQRLTSAFRLNFPAQISAVLPTSGDRTYLACAARCKGHDGSATELYDCRGAARAPGHNQPMPVAVLVRLDGRPLRWSGVVVVRVGLEEHGLIDAGAPVDVGEPLDGVRVVFHHDAGFRQHGRPVLQFGQFVRR